MTLWHPDTCDCQIEISDDPKTLGETVQHIVKCKFHQNSDHDAVLAENRNKNQALAALAEAIPELTDISWSLEGNDAQRTIKIVLPEGADKALADQTLASFDSVDAVLDVVSLKDG